MSDSLNIVVIGAGAIGGWVGGRLAVGGHTVTLVGRKRLVNAVNQGGLRLSWPKKTGGVSADSPSTLVQHNIHAVTSIADAAPFGPFDLAIFAVKTFDTDSTIVEMQAADLGQATILALQNGVRSEEKLSKTFGPQRVIAGSELNPISTPDPGAVLLEKWRGGIGLAPVVPGASVERWVQAFDPTVLPTRAYADYRAMKWSKLLLNLIGNASAAILDMNTVEVYSDRRLFSLEIEMLREAVAVMRRLGLTPVTLPGYPVPLLARGVRWAPQFLLGPVFRKLVAGGRGEKPPSLLLDLSRGRNSSEVADLNGAVVRAGEQIGVATPVNRALTEILTRLVDGRIQWDSVRKQPGVLLAVTEEMRRKEKT